MHEFTDIKNFLTHIALERISKNEENARGVRRMNIKLIFVDGNTLSKKCHNKVTPPFSKTTYTVLPTPPFLCKKSEAPFFGELGKPLIPPPSLCEMVGSNYNVVM